MTASERLSDEDKVLLSMRQKATCDCMLLSVSTLQKVRKNRVVAGNRPLAGENRRLVAGFFVSFPNSNASSRRREQDDESADTDVGVDDITLVSLLLLSYQEH